MYVHKFFRYISQQSSNWNRCFAQSWKKVSSSSYPWGIFYNASIRMSWKTKNFIHNMVFTSTNKRIVLATLKLSNYSTIIDNNNSKLIIDDKWNEISKCRINWIINDSPQILQDNRYKYLSSVITYSWFIEQMFTVHSPSLCKLDFIRQVFFIYRRLTIKFFIVYNINSRSQLHCSIIIGAAIWF